MSLLLWLLLKMMILLFRQRKRPESGSIRRPFRQSDSVSSSDTSEPASPGATVRPTSQPVMSQTFSREAPDRCSISGHGTVSSISRHSSLKNRMDSPQIRKAMAAGRSKSFNNHRPLDPEVIAQVTIVQSPLKLLLSSW